LAERTWQQQMDNWLGLLCSGDERAFAQFIDKYKEMVFLCCRQLGLREDEIEDVASEIFLAAYKGLKGYRGKAELGTWLWSIAYRQGFSYLRKNRRHSQLEDECQNELAGSLWLSCEHDEPIVATQDKERTEIIWEAVEKLPRLWALSVILHYREEKSVAEIAKIMRIKQNTVKTYLFRGRERLKQMIAAALGENIDDDN
jgi:RNA polymerase sigma-70 factor (ECF subfamily)